MYLVHVDSTIRPPSPPSGPHGLGMPPYHNLFFCLPNPKSVPMPLIILYEKIQCNDFFKEFFFVIFQKLQGFKMLTHRVKRLLLQSRPKSNPKDEERESQSKECQKTKKFELKLMMVLVEMSSSFAVVVGQTWWRWRPGNHHFYCFCN